MIFRCAIASFGLAVIVIAIHFAITTTEVRHVDIEFEVSPIPRILKSELRADRPILSTIRIHNHSSDSQTFKYLGSSCGCMSVEIHNRRLKVDESFIQSPGEIVTLTVVVDHSMQHGERKYDIAIMKMNDQSHAVIRIPIQFRIDPDVQLVPDVLGINTRASSSKIWSKTMTLTYRYRADNPIVGQPLMNDLPMGLTIANVSLDANNDMLDATLRESTWKIELKYDADVINQQSSGAQTASIFVSVGGSAAPLATQTFPIILSTKLGISAPSALDFSKLSTADRTRPLMLISDDNRAFMIRSVRTHGDDFKVQQKLFHTAKSHRIDVTALHDSLNSSTIEIETDHPFRPRIVVAVRGNVRP
jgi:hypothetical protein